MLKKALGIKGLGGWQGGKSARNPQWGLDWRKKKGGGGLPCWEVVRFGDNSKPNREIEVKGEKTGKKYSLHREGYRGSYGKQRVGSAKSLGKRLQGLL